MSDVTFDMATNRMEVHQKWGKSHENDSPPAANRFLLFRCRPAQASALRSEAGGALRSRAKKSEFASTRSETKRKDLPGSQKSPTNVTSARPAEF